MQGSMLQYRVPDEALHTSPGFVEVSHAVLSDSRYINLVYST